MALIKSSMALVDSGVGLVEFDRQRGEPAEAAYSVTSERASDDLMLTSWSSLAWGLQASAHVCPFLVTAPASSWRVSCFHAAFWVIPANSAIDFVE